VITILPRGQWCFITKRPRGQWCYITIIPTGQWCDITVLNVYAPTEDRNDTTDDVYDVRVRVRSMQRL
jgi:hypothetical protein